MSQFRKELVKLLSGVLEITEEEAEKELEKALEKLRQ